MDEHHFSPPVLKPTTVPKVLASTIATIIPQILGENIADKKIDAETKVNLASEQAVYFFSILKQIRTKSDEKRSKRNPIKKIRKRMSSQSSIGSGSHRRSNSNSSFSLKRINSQSSFTNSSQKSLNSKYSVDGVGDDKTAENSGTQTSRGSKGCILWR